MKKIVVLLAYCCLTGCVADTGADSYDMYSDPYGAPYGQSTPYMQTMPYGQPVEYQQPMEYSQPFEYGQPVEYVQPMDSYPPIEYTQPTTYTQPVEVTPNMPYDIQPYANMYQGSSTAPDTNTNHYPPALPKSRPYRRPL